MILLNAYQNPFTISDNIGNNEFSHSLRTQKKIEISKLEETSLFLFEESKHIAFCEFDKEKNKDCCMNGIYPFVYDTKYNAYLFDNHNHAFYFIYHHYLHGAKWDTLIHVDQHKDSRIPKLSFLEFQSYCKSIFQNNTIEIIFPVNTHRIIFEKVIFEVAGAMLKKPYHISSSSKTLYFSEFELEIPSSPIEQDDFIAWIYTNFVLNVGNFIPPLLKTNIFKSYYCVDSSYTLEQIASVDLSDMVLDLDLDFFSKDMDYIPFKKKKNIVKELIQKSKLITIATSPYFIELNDCKKVLHELFQD